MDKEWIPILGAVLAVGGTICGIILGGTITSVVKWLELRHQLQLSEQSFIRSKLEKCHELIGQHLSILTGVQSSIITKLAEHTQLPQLLPIYQEMHSEIQRSLITLIPELRIYVPQATDLTTQAYKSSHTFSAILANVVGGKESIENSFDAFKKAKTDWTRVQAVVEDLVHQTFRFSRLQNNRELLTAPSGDKLPNHDKGIGNLPGKEA